ncbi:MAG: NAD-dependent epimerase/dehydratase family protein [Bdellovibrionales bacterium]|nr:NAD-dependent epimerase/dehydratase family protein [Bdellovibrionales bacterium]
MKSIDVELNSLALLGATGWVGSQVAQFLDESHFFSKIYLMSRTIEEKQNVSRPQIHLQNIDLSKNDFEIPLTENLLYLAGGPPHSGGHFQAHWQPKALENILKKFFDSNGKRAIIISSGAVYEGLKISAEGYLESQWAPVEVSAQTPYAQVKQQEEIIVERFRKRGHIIHVGRLFACLGPGFSELSTYAFVDFLRQYKESGKIQVTSPTSLRSYIHTRDLSEYLIRWILKPSEKSETVNLCGLEPVSLKSFAQSLFPKADFQFGELPINDYFGNPKEMLNLNVFNDFMSVESMIDRLRRELML